MRFLLHTPLPPAALQAHEHKTHELAELGLGAEASAAEILKGANGKQWEIVTADPALPKAALAREAAFGRCIVYLQLSSDPAAGAEAMNRLFARYPRLSPGRLYTVTASRVKVRQLPSSRTGI